MTKKKNISSNQLKYNVISKNFHDNNIKTDPNEINRVNNINDFHNNYDYDMIFERSTNSNSNQIPLNLNIEGIYNNKKQYFESVDYKNNPKFPSIDCIFDTENENYLNKHNNPKNNLNNINNVNYNKINNLSKQKNNNPINNQAKLLRNNSASSNISKPNYNRSPKKFQKNKMVPINVHDQDKMDIEEPLKNNIEDENIYRKFQNNVRSKKNYFRPENKISRSITTNNIRAITDEQMKIINSNEFPKINRDGLLDEEVNLKTEENTRVDSKLEANLNAPQKQNNYQQNNLNVKEKTQNIENNPINNNHNYNNTKYDLNQTHTHNRASIDYYSRFVPILQKYEKNIPMEYIPEIWRNLKMTENCEACMPKFDLLSEQVDINFDMRAILIDWIIDVHKNYRLFPETLFICIAIIDRYLIKKQILRTRLQLLGTTALFISSKYEEVIYPCIEEFTKVTDDAYNKEEVLQMENEIFHELQFDITYPSSYRFFEIISLNYNFSEIEFYYGCYLLEYFLISPNSNKYYPSIIALAVVLLILKLKNYENYRDLYNLTDSVENQKLIKQCAKEIYEFPHKCRNFNLHSVHKKYSSPQYYYVAVNELENNNNGDSEQNDPAAGLTSSNNGTGGY